MDSGKVLTISSTGSSNISDPSSCSPSGRCWHSVNGGGGVDDRLELLLLLEILQNYLKVLYTIILYSTII